MILRRILLGTSRSIEEYPWVIFEIEKRATEVLSIVLAEKDGFNEADLKKNETL